MGNLSENDSSDNILEKYYYYHLWKDRLNWTRHVIPVRIKDPETGFFLEAYLDAPPIPKDPETQVTTVTISFLPIFMNQEKLVTLRDIYPSSRNLKRMVKIEGKIVIEEVPVDDKFVPTKKHPLHKVKEIFQNYIKLPFTLPELESLLNNKIPEQYVKENLKPQYERQCLITAEKLLTYYHKDVEGPVELVFDKVELEKSQMNAVIHTSLTDLKTAYADCQQCYLGVACKNRSTRPVFGRLGSKQSLTPIDNTILFIGEAPGVQEEATDQVFLPTAPAGEVLFKVLKAAKFDYERCYFSNAVLCRPEPTQENLQNGQPTVEAIDACNSRLKNEIALVSPKVIVLLGRIAYRAFFGKEPKSVLSLVGWQNEQKTIYFLPHPSYIVRELNFAQEDKKITIKNDYLNHFLEINKRVNV